MYLPGSTVDRLEKAIARYQSALKLSSSATEDKIHELSVAVDCAAMHLMNRVNYHSAVALRVDNWLPACNGAEEPFETRTRRKLMYCWNPATGKHAYYDYGTDMILTDEEAQIALGV